VPPSRAADTTDFSRVVFQLSPNKQNIAAADTNDFSRVVFQLSPNKQNIAGR
jgi:hypothetical protein